MTSIYRPADSDDLHVVVGGQFGSEGKGAVTARIIRRAIDGGYDSLNIRVGGPNAGHTVIDSSGRAWPLRQVPVGAVFPGTQLYIGPGSEIDPNVLLEEIIELNNAGHNLIGRLFVSAEATVLEEHHHQVETDLNLSGELGSTSKGIGAARAARVMRDAKRVRDDDELCTSLVQLGVDIWSNLSLPSTPFTSDHRQVVIEGTQGYGLGLHAGFYPYCTSGDARAIDFLAQAGINPWDDSIYGLQVWVVVRPNPIRVAGNSGPLLGETTWEQLGLSPEYTTVTKKVRRVGAWDPCLVRDAVEANGGPPAVRLALTMVDHLFPGVYGNERTITDKGLYMKVRELTERIHDEVGAPVRMITTGPSSGMFW